MYSHPTMVGAVLQAATWVVGSEPWGIKGKAYLQWIKKVDAFCGIQCIIHWKNFLIS